MGSEWSSAEQSNAERISAAIDRLDPAVIMVDYFETLVTRSITGKQIKRVTARFLKERLSLDASVDEIHAGRHAAEVDLRRAAVARGSDPEHRLDDMAEAMWDDLGSSDAATPGRGAFIDAVISVELAVERAAQTLDHDIVAVLREAKASHRLVIVSDFHIPSPWFDQMLEFHGIDDLFEQVIISCDHELSKASGRLYPRALERVTEAAPPPETSMQSQVLMIGDHPVSDGTRAAEHGLATISVERPAPARANRLQRRFATTELARRQELRRLIAAQPEGFGELAITLYEFTRRLHERARVGDTGSLTFLAREGKILRTLFSRYDATSPLAAGQHIDTDYLMVSRRSTYLPSLEPLDSEDFSRLTSMYPDLDVSDLLENLGFEPEDRRTILHELASHGHEAPEADHLRQSATFRRLYCETRTDQRALLLRLLDQLVGPDAPLHVVDVGWKGTMQDHLQSVLGPSRPVTGYYLGIVPGRHMLDEGTKIGLLFDGRGSTTPAQRTLRHFKSLYEFLLQADHGSARRYVETDASSIVRAELDEQELEAEVFASHIGPVQDQLEALFGEICRADALRDAPLVGDLADVARFHERMLFFPTRAEVDRILAIRHYENFGPLGFVGTDSNIGTTEKLRRAASLLRRPDTLTGAGWPPLELEAAGLVGLTKVVGGYRWFRARRAERGSEV